MQQKCRTCEGEFDGPATCVGSNLCRDCKYKQLAHQWKNAPGGMFQGEKDRLLTLQQEEIERLKSQRDPTEGRKHIGYCVGCQGALYSDSGAILGSFGRWYHHWCLSKDDRSRLKSTIIDASKAAQAAGGK